MRFVPKISDFGLVKLIEDDTDATASGLVLGTPSYMAPEQTGLIDGAIGPQSDVYGLGAIFYELLTGRRPFQGPTPLQTIVQAVSEDVVGPRTIRRDLPVDLETICLKCLEFAPLRRYPTAAALAEDLRCFSTAGHRGAAGRRAGACLEVGARNPAYAAMAVLSVVVVLLLIAGTLFYLASMRGDGRIADGARPHPHRLARHRAGQPGNARNAGEGKPRRARSPAPRRPPPPRPISGPARRWTL